MKLHRKIRAIARAGLPLLLALPSVSLAEDLSRFTRDLVTDIRPLALPIRDLQVSEAGLGGQIQNMVQASGGTLAMRETDDSIVLSITSDVLFDFDSAALAPPAREALTELADLLASNPDGPVQVVGHTDAKGADDYNLRLSEERAKAVADFLRDAGIPAERLTPIGRGETEPIAPNEVDGRDNPKGRALNRRVELILPK